MTEESNYLGTERWRQHPTLPIQVSNLSRVKVRGRIQTPRKDSGNNYYWRVSLGSRKLGRGRRHRLVGETWLNAGVDDCVLHRDEELPPDLIDCVDNLWLGTRIDNYKDRDQKGRLKGKKKNIISQDMRRLVLGMRELGLLYKEIADIIGLPLHSVNNIIARGL